MLITGKAVNILSYQVNNCSNEPVGTRLELFDGRVVKRVKGLFSAMEMPREGFARLRFGDTYDNLHIGPG